MSFVFEVMTIQLTNHHDVELKALLHGLPPHLLQDGVDANVAEVAGVAPLPLGGRLGLVKLGGVRHVAVARIDL